MDMIDQYTIGRRAMIAQLAALLGVAALPEEALAAPRRRRRGRGAAASAGRFLAPAQFALLSAVADTIMPRTDSVGALDAHVPARLDALLRNWASPKTRSDVIGALTRIDAAAVAAKGKGFVALTPADRLAVLTPHDAAALKSVPPPPGAPKPTIFSMMSYVADNGYLKIKDLVLTLYYYSAEATAKELAYVHVPGKFQPSVKLTPQSRPELGVGPF